MLFVAETPIMAEVLCEKMIVMGCYQDALLLACLRDFASAGLSVSIRAQKLDSKRFESNSEGRMQTACLLPIACLHSNSSACLLLVY
jgi:hypothetical protein